MKEISKQAARMMKMVWAIAPHDFVGLGLVWYEHLEKLPHLQLQVPGDVYEAMYVSGEESVALALARASAVSSPLHDGFHFVNLRSLSLTHVSQLVCPNIPSSLLSVPRESGARHMTAALASLTEGIVLVSVLTALGEITLYEAGTRICVKGTN